MSVAGQIRSALGPALVAVELVQHGEVDPVGTEQRLHDSQIGRWPSVCAQLVHTDHMLVRAPPFSRDNTAFRASNEEE
jgi:hypothetical protein